MAQQSTLAQRRKILLLCSQGIRSADIAQQVGLSIWTVRKWRQRLKKGVAFNPAWADLANRNA